MAVASVGPVPDRSSSRAGLDLVVWPAGRAADRDLAGQRVRSPKDGCDLDLTHDRLLCRAVSVPRPDGHPSDGHLEPTLSLLPR
jgi:hypothetical protein